MSLNELNRWFLSIWESGVQAGKEKEEASIKADENIAWYSDEELYEKTSDNSKGRTGAGWKNRGCHHGRKGKQRMKEFLSEHWILIYGLFMYAMGILSGYFF